MRKFKRAALICFAGLCLSGLALVGGERFQIKGFDVTSKSTVDGTVVSSGITYCPFYLYGQYSGVYYYSAYVAYQDQCGGVFTIGAPRLHTLGTSCTDCPDPIAGSAHPLPAGEFDGELSPKPDALFSGILR